MRSPLLAALALFGLALTVTGCHRAFVRVDLGGHRRHHHPQPRVVHVEHCPPPPPVCEVPRRHAPVVVVERAPRRRPVVVREAPRRPRHHRGSPVYR